MAFHRKVFTLQENMPTQKWLDSNHEPVHWKGIWLCIPISHTSPSRAVASVRRARTVLTVGEGCNSIGVGASFWKGSVLALMACANSSRVDLSSGINICMESSPVTKMRHFYPFRLDPKLLSRFFGIFMLTSEIYRCSRFGYICTKIAGG